MKINEREILNKITDEVNEFHPLLDKLLRKLPTIQETEYTHGPNEMGADFVLLRLDQAVKNTSYIGVIAKVGRIAQDFADIERQIDECRVERPFNSGAKKIRLNEVWVVTTGGITSGAERKIQEKFSTQNIVFIDCDKLIDLINAHLPSFWSDVNVVLGEYLSNLVAKTKEADHAFSLVGMDGENFYIEQDVFSVPIATYGKRVAKRNKVNFHKELEKNSLVLIEGGMGSGKSKFLRELLYYYGNPHVFLTQGFIPAALSASELVEAYDSEIKQVLEKLIPAEVHQALDNPKYLLLIDSLDEKKLEIREINELLSSLRNQLADLQNVKLVITSRYMRGLDDTEKLDSSIQRYELPSLSFAKTIEFLTKICKNLSPSSRLIEDLKKSPLFRELPQSPIAAILLAKLINENTRELPSNLTELYSQYLELMLGRWDIDKGLQTLKEFRAIERIIMELAKVFIDNNLESITVTDAKEVIKSYLEQRNLDLNAEELFANLLNRSGVVVSDNSQRHIFFKHRTFAEYYYAKFYSQSGSFNLSNALSLYWSTTTFFYLGLKNDAPDLLQQIGSLNLESEDLRWMKLINMGSYMLAAYSTPYDVVIKLFYQTFVEATQLFQDIVDRKIDSNLQRLPHMAILFLMQLIIRDCYGFDFFTKAIEETVLQIDESGLPDATKAYAIFFLEVTNLEIGNKETFDFLLEQYDDSLPVDLSLAIGYETKDFKNRTRLMKSQDKRIKKLMETHNYKKLLNQLRLTPVKES